jgi:hypothetical protein
MEYNVIISTIIAIAIIIKTLCHVIREVSTAIIVCKVPKDRLTALYHLEALKRGIVTIPQLHREVKQIPKTKAVAESSLHK